ncbi:hypothetical protein OIU77_005482 [Salix suchowensis]|uniref:Uncharacterized protein n=1 Tax=Salix suchowensis TaxID=1278906 RepID=A0ABQ9APJ0_9ROSI|nr:hypothetical protein OIU77_005482 [Salix suchowensis]
MQRTPLSSKLAHDDNTLTYVASLGLTKPHLASSRNIISLNSLIASSKNPFFANPLITLVHETTSLLGMLLRRKQAEPTSPFFA